MWVHLRNLTVWGWLSVIMFVAANTPPNTLLRRVANRLRSFTPAVDRRDARH